MGYKVWSRLYILRSVHISFSQCRYKNIESFAKILTNWLSKIIHWEVRAAVSWNFITFVGRFSRGGIGQGSGLQTVNWQDIHGKRNRSTCLCWLRKHHKGVEGGQPRIRRRWFNLSNRHICQWVSFEVILWLKLPFRIETSVFFLFKVFENCN